MGYRIVYLRPPVMAGNGVRSYSDRILEACSRYGEQRHTLVDADKYLFNNSLSSDSMSRQWGTKLAELVRREEADLVFAEMGVGDFQVFHALREVKDLMPHISTMVTVHDPPRTVVNLNPLFYSYQNLTSVRALRWFYNRTVGRIMESHFIRQGHSWLLLSERGKHLWQKHLDSVRAGHHNVHVMPHLNYCDTQTAYPVHLPGMPVRLGVLGSINRSKGIDTLIEALAYLETSGQLPEGITLEIAGAPLFRDDRICYQKLQQQVSDRGLSGRVTFTGFLPEEELPRFFSRINLLVLPYRETGSGSVSGPLMWARSFGTPVIASRTRNIVEMVKDHFDGLTFQPGDAAALADCLHAASRRPLLMQLGDGAQQLRDEYAWPVCVARLTEIFDKLTTTERNRAPT